MHELNDYAKGDSRHVVDVVLSVDGGASYCPISKVVCQNSKVFLCKVFQLIKLTDEGLSSITSMRRPILSDRGGSGCLAIRQFFAVAAIFITPIACLDLRFVAITQLRFHICTKPSPF